MAFSAIAGAGRARALPSYHDRAWGDRARADLIDQLDSPATSLVGTSSPTAARDILGRCAGLAPTARLLQPRHHGGRSIRWSAVRALLSEERAVPHTHDRPARPPQASSSTLREERRHGAALRPRHPLRSRSPRAGWGRRYRSTRRVDKLAKVMNNFEFVDPTHLSAAHGGAGRRGHAAQLTFAPLMQIQTCPAARSALGRDGCLPGSLDSLVPLGQPHAARRHSWTADCAEWSRQVDLLARDIAVRQTRYSGRHRDLAHTGGRSRRHDMLLKLTRLAFPVESREQMRRSAVNRPFYDLVACRDHPPGPTSATW